jgi:hypothetical protein
MRKIEAAIPIIALLIVLVFAVFPFNHVSCSFLDATVEMSGGPIKLYIVDLDGVGGSRAANHSAVVDGAIGVTFVNLYKRITMWEGALKLHVYINVTYEVVKDWQTYRHVVEDANDTIIVNTHDEILPVPDGCTKEGWTATIGDFMLNRWGTWVHTGGLPFRIVHYENGTTEEWNDGFKKLMQHANLNVTIGNPPSSLLIEMENAARMDLGNFCIGNTTNIISIFWYALINSTDPDFCLKYGATDTDTSILPIYSMNSSIDLNVYTVSAALRLSKKTVDKYGVFIYSSPWNFADHNGDYFSNYGNSLGMGAISSAAAIWCEAGYAAKKIVEANAAKVKDEAMVQKANEAFNAGNYKQAVIYAEKATAPSQPNILPAIILTAVAGTAITTTAIIHHRNNKNKKKEYKLDNIQKLNHI